MLHCYQNVKITVNLQHLHFQCLHCATENKGEILVSFHEENDKNSPNLPNQVEYLKCWQPLKFPVLYIDKR